MSITRPLAITLCLLASLAAANAQQRPPFAIADQTGAEACDVLSVRLGSGRYWVGRFIGSDNDPFDRRAHANITACFRTERQCRRFLYEMRTDYQLHQELAECRRGG